MQEPPSGKSRPIWRMPTRPKRGSMPPVAVVALPTPTTTIREAMTAAGLPIDLAARGVLALPVYALPVAAVERLAGFLPVV